MKKLLCILLAVTLLAVSLPMTVLAEASEAAEPAVPETTGAAEPSVPETTEAAEPAVPETTEAAELAVPETTEAAEPAAPETTEAVEPAVSETAETVEETEPEISYIKRSVRMDRILGDNEQMLEGYVREIFYADGKTKMASTGGRDALNSKGKQIYDHLEHMVLEVAAGREFITRLDHLEITVTAEELGVSNIWNGNRIEETAMQHIFDLFDSVIFGVLEDHPYESFWISKADGIAYSFGYSGSGDSVTLYYGFEMPVAEPYAKIGGKMDSNGEFYIEADPGAASAGSTARKAADFAKKIVQENAALNDWDKLHRYQEIVCDLVAYDHDAAAAGPNRENGSTPWQLINVFDRDPDTNVVCEGYSKAFQYLCELSSFQNDVVCYQDLGTIKSKSGTSGGHMWNVVSINGRKLLADVTNSDSGSFGQDGSLFLVPARHVNGGFRVKGITYQEVKYLPDERGDTVQMPEKKPTCQETGRKACEQDWTGLLYIKENGKRKSVTPQQLEIPALGHDYQVTYHWSADGKGCTALKVCSRNSSHRSEETGTVSSEVLLAATCGTRGKTSYTAAFQADWAETQTQVLEDIPATGKHVYDNDQDDICNVCGRKRGEESDPLPIYRLYNPYTGEHLLSNNETEKNSLVKAGWNLDGVAWNSAKEGTTVYRLYNPYDGSHLYSRNETEIQNCLKLGWKMDGPVSHSAEKENGIPIFRLFNPYVKAHYHLFSTSQAEISMLTRAGWVLEGVAWYAAK